jgi:hypothetical protein
MKVTVYFEAGAGAHVVAQFDEEDTYMACLPALEALAESKGYIVTESLDFDDPKQTARAEAFASLINNAFLQEENKND